MLEKDKVRNKMLINSRFLHRLYGRLNEGRKLAGHVVSMGNTRKTYNIVVEEA
jgi:hypothetical protein